MRHIIAPAAVQELRSRIASNQSSIDAIGLAARPQCLSPLHSLTSWKKIKCWVKSSAGDVSLLTDDPVVIIEKN